MTDFIIVNCLQCNAKIKKYPSQIKQSKNKRFFCNRKCFYEWRSTNLIGDKVYHYKKPIKTKCDYCEKTIYKKEFHFRYSKHSFCNHSCYSKWLSENHTGEKSNLWRGGKIIVNCANCGKQVKRIRYEVENRSEKFFCNTKCMGEWQSKNYKRENHPNWKGRIIVQCSYCGNDIEKERWRPKTKYHFCNYQCSGKWQSENMTGDARYNWKGGRLPYYGPNWNSQKYKTRKRDNFTCQVCHISEEEHIKKYNQKLHVHHIKPFREFNYVASENDNYKEANSLSNLLTVCCVCHRIVESS